ncbi:MAG: alpha/beta fold hydrolase [Actinomycetota bacterium]|nr:alpha/beta fold hydrolase [Actinomycetota bacterium]
MNLFRLRPPGRAWCLAVLFVIAGCGVTAASPAPKSTREATPTTTSETPPSTPTTTVSTARLPPIVHRPAGLSYAQKVPLVIALHGSAASPTGMQYITGMNTVANQHGFVVAYLASANPAHGWSSPSDTQYVHGMIATLTRIENIDPTRVYVIGFSAGGFETWKVACLYSSQIAGIAIVANNMNMKLYNTCRLSHPVSEYLLVGGADAIRPAGIPGRLPSAAETTARWRQLDGCSNGSARPLTAANVTFEIWSSCVDSSSVALTYVGGGLHNWPGGPTITAKPDPYSKRYSASQAIWAFLSPHTLSPTKLAGSLLSVKATGGKRRTIAATFQLAESVDVTAALRGRGHTFRFRTAALRAGAAKQLRIRVPLSTAGGRYSIKLTIVDSYGRQLTVTRTTRVPKP